MSKRNGLSDSFVAGKRNHTFTKADLEKQIKKTFVYHFKTT